MCDHYQAFSTTGYCTVGCDGRTDRFGCELRKKLKKLGGDNESSVKDRLRSDVFLRVHWKQSETSRTQGKDASEKKRKKVILFFGETLAVAVGEVKE